MRRKNLSLVALCLMVGFLSSCLGDSNEEMVTYDDTAVTSFSISTLRQTVYTKTKSGTDSTYVRDFDASSYRFYIDPLRKVIYNPDSLPVGVNIRKVVCAISAKNRGVVALKNSHNDSIKFFKSTDSLDFSVPRQFVIYNDAGTDTAQYTVMVNVHKEVGNVFKWSQVLNQQAALGALTAMKALVNDRSIYVFGNQNDQPKIYTAATDGATQWQEVTPNIPLNTDFYKNVVLKDGVFYAYQTNTLMASTDAKTWNKVSDIALQQLLGASTTKLYALADGGKIWKSKDNGVSWATEQLDSDGALLPTADICFAVQPFKTNATANRLLLVGTTNTQSSIWGKVEENDEYAENQPWLYYTPSAVNKYPLPNLAHLQVITYGDGLVALGGEGIGNSVGIEPFSQIYYSVDGGLTWKEEGTLTYPATFASHTSAFAVAVDQDSFLWLICGETGQVWKGRLNRLGWSAVEKVFYE